MANTMANRIADIIRGTPNASVAALSILDDERVYAFFEQRFVNRQVARLNKELRCPCCGSEDTGHRRYR